MIGDTKYNYFLDNVCLKQPLLKILLDMVFDPRNSQMTSKIAPKPTGIKL